MSANGEAKKKCSLIQSIELHKHTHTHTPLYVLSTLAMACNIPYAAFIITTPNRRKQIIAKSLFPWKITGVLLMKTTERKVCLQLISIGRACTALAGVCLPLGQCMEALIRLLIQLYVCLANLTKHLIVRSALVVVAHHQNK